MTTRIRSVVLGNTALIPRHCRRTTKFDVVTHMGVRVSWGQTQRGYPKSAEFQRSRILGLSCIYAYILQCRTTKFGMVTNMGRGVFIGGQPRLHKIMHRAVCQR